MASTNSTVFGTLYAASRLLAYARTSSTVGGDDGSAGSITACTRRPHSGSCNPITTTSAIPGWSMSAVSISAGKTLAPPVMIMSTRRSTMWR